ncbi:MAG: hypothetical protein WCD73_22245 [Pseudolabrys sp.]
MARKVEPPAHYVQHASNAKKPTQLAVTATKKKTKVATADKKKKKIKVASR